MAWWNYIVNLDWNAILTALGLSVATITCIFIFGGKTLINWWMDRGKFNYQKKLDAQLETHKADLVRTTNELQERLRIEYGSLYKERLEAIKGIYEKLFEIERFLRTFKPLPAANLPIMYEEIDNIMRYTGKLTACISSLDQQIGISLIYFSEKDAEKLNYIVDELHKLKSAIGDWEFAVEDGNTSCKAINDSVKEMKDADIPLFIASVRDAFRKLIGVNPL